MFEADADFEGKIGDALLIQEPIQKRCFALQTLPLLVLNRLLSSTAALLPGSGSEHIFCHSIYSDVIGLVHLYSFKNYLED